MTDEIIVNMGSGMASAVASQNDAILQAMINPPVYRQYGYFEDPHGQTIYVDERGITHHCGERQLNGWTI